MQQAFITMLTLQDRMNRKVHPQWIDQEFAWYRAIWIECAELMDHYGYKWWKQQHTDVQQVQLEVVDIWHFGMSALFSQDKTIEQLAAQMHESISGYVYLGHEVREATEKLAAYSLTHKSFSVPAFWDLLHAVGLNPDTLYQQYVGKNVLNFFRQDNGYKDGSYIKQWQGREDNEHLVDVLASLDSQREDFQDAVYQALQQRYNAVTAG